MSEQSDFMSQGVRCGGTLYLPEGVESPPVVVMAHGFAAEKAFGLPAYAERFVAEGMAAFLFDYRCFGESDGAPRNLVDPKRHLQDWRAAIAHVRGLAEVDGSRVALWGSSFAGGHVIVIASEDHELAGIVSQVPFVDSRAGAADMDTGKKLQAAMHGFRDLFRSITFRAPHYIPVIGEPDTFAIMNTPECMEGYRAIVPEDSDWRNGCPARILLTIGSYRPVTHAHKVRCPALLMAGEEDSLIPIAAVKAAAAKIPQGRFVSLPINHFDIYTGEPFETAVAQQSGFLKEVLGIA